jgi:hypothetical protein
LPLPVYTEPSVDYPLGLPVSDHHVRRLIVSCERSIPTFVIADLEEFLDATMESVAANGAHEDVTVAEVVASVANTEYAHYDADIPLVLDRLRSHVYLDMTALHRVILALGATVLELARWVSREASSRGSGSGA